MTKFKVGDIIRCKETRRGCLKKNKCYKIVEYYGTTFVRLEKQPGCVCTDPGKDFCGGWREHSFELSLPAETDKTSNPDKTAHPVCPYALGKAVPVEPVSERLYRGMFYNAELNPDSAETVDNQKASLALRAIKHAQRGVRAMPVCNVTGQPVDIVAVHLREIKMKGTGKTTYEAQFKCPTCYENYDSGEGK